MNLVQNIHLCIQIKAEKAQEDEEKEAARRDEEERIRMENILTGNPLLKVQNG